MPIIYFLKKDREEKLQNPYEINWNWLAGFHFSNCTFDKKKHSVKLQTHLSKATHQG